MKTGCEITYDGGYEKRDSGHELRFIFPRIKCKDSTFKKNCLLMERLCNRCSNKGETN